MKFLFCVLILLSGTFASAQDWRPSAEAQKALMLLNPKGPMEITFFYKRQRRAIVEELFQDQVISEKTYESLVRAVERFEGGESILNIIATDPGPIARDFLGGHLLELNALQKGDSSDYAELRPLQRNALNLLFMNALFSTTRADQMAEVARIVQTVMISSRHQLVHYPVMVTFASFYKSVDGTNYSDRGKFLRGLIFPVFETLLKPHLKANFERLMPPGAGLVAWQEAMAGRFNSQSLVRPRLSGERAIILPFPGLCSRIFAQ